MSRQNSTKLLIVGDVNGNFEALFKRVSAVDKKVGPFDMLFCVGEFFGQNKLENDRLLQSEIAIPIPTYILGPCSKLTSAFYPSSPGAELAPQLVSLGRQGHFQSATGLSIAYLSGIEPSGLVASAASAVDDSVHFDVNLVDRLLEPVRRSVGSFTGVDILLTSQWPVDVAKYAPVPLTDNDQEPTQHTTRFVGLASVNNSAKSKWLYAFNIVPMSRLTRPELTEQPVNASEFPYMDVLTSLAKINEHQVAGETVEKQQQYFFAGLPDEDTVDRGGKRKFQANRHDDQSGQKRQPQQPCWFCLSSPEVEKHLVISIGDSCYLALAKGALVSRHVLILPVDHIQSVCSSPAPVLSDIDKFERSLSQMFASSGECAVFFERNYRSQHLQIQAIPVPIDRHSALKSAFLDQAELHGFRLTQLDDDQQLQDVVNVGCPYFLVKLPDGSRLFTRQMKNFPIQFGREVLTSETILNMTEKVDWRSCTVSKEEETKLSQEFRDMYAPFDFTEDDDT